MESIKQFNTDHIDTKEKEIVIAFLGISYEDYDKICSAFKNRVGYILMRSESLERVKELGYNPETVVVGTDFKLESMPDDISFITISDEIGKDGDNFLSISNKELENQTGGFKTHIEKTVDVIAHDSLRMRMNRLIRQKQSQISDLLKSVKNYDDVEELKPQILEMFSEKDSTTYNHTLAVYELVDVMALGMEQMGQPLSEKDIQTLRSIALLHDIGKLITPDQLIKNNDSFTSSEFSIMKQHASKNFDFVEQEYIREIYNKALTHHYRYDGEGYHNQAEIGSNIDIFSRMMTVIDSFEAMNSSDRPYTKQNPQSIEKSFETLFNNSQEKSEEYQRGGQFDPLCAKAFLLGFKHKIETDTIFREKWLGYEMQKELNQGTNRGIITPEEKLGSMLEALDANIAKFDNQNFTKK